MLVCYESRRARLTSNQVDYLSWQGNQPSKSCSGRTPQRSHRIPKSSRDITNKSFLLLLLGISGVYYSHGLLSKT